ncbi:MAG: methionyl-tRNA formyltransferase [Desulfatibacillaceae bacterium]
MAQEGLAAPTVVLAGSVQSSRRTLQGLLRHGVNVAGVLGLAPESARFVPGYARMDDLCAAAGIRHAEFTDINSPECMAFVRELAPDLLFVVGLAQLVRRPLLSMPRLGSIGFHPAWLPEGRGRSPISWLILEGRPGAATFFLIDDGVDSGPILAQEPFPITDRDYTSDVLDKLEAAIDKALDRWIPRLLAGKWEPMPQIREDATFTGRQSPSDAVIDWELPAEGIQARIRAHSRPYSGAYTYYRDRKLVVWEAEVDNASDYRGVVGRVIQTRQGKGPLVQCGSGLLCLTETEIQPGLGEEGRPGQDIAVGARLGYNTENEIFKLKQRIAQLERIVKQSGE